MRSAGPIRTAPSAKSRSRWPPTATGGTDPAAFQVTVRTASRNGYTGRYTLESTLPGRCRAASNPGHAYEALYDPITRSANGRTHSKQLTLGMAVATTVYAVCRSHTGGHTTEVAIRLP